MARTGSSDIAGSGSRALTASATICASSKPRRRRRNVAERNSSGAAANERTVVITRTFDAPRELVFKAWTDAKHLTQWWGPKGFRNAVCEVDARPGGRLRIVMRAPDGAEQPMTGVFREVRAPARLVFTYVAVDRDGKPLLEGLTTVPFAEQGGKTKLTVESRAVG